MKKEKSPAFQFYPKDWVSDARIRCMNPEQRGVYIDLICHCWLEKGLPNDMGKLVSLGNYPASIISFEKRVWSVLKECFYLKSGKWFQKRLDHERKKQINFRNAKSKAGKIGNKVRWGNKLHQDNNSSHSDVSAIAKDRSSSSFSSSSPSSDKDKAKPSPKTAQIPEKEFIDILKNNPAYKNIDFESELGKMDAWILTHPGRQKTRRFIINWLNKVDQSMPVKSQKNTMNLNKKQIQNIEALDDFSKRRTDRNGNGDIQTGLRLPGGSISGVADSA